MLVISERMEWRANETDIKLACSVTWLLVSALHQFRAAELVHCASTVSSDSAGGRCGTLMHLYSPLCTFVVVLGVPYAEKTFPRERRSELMVAYFHHKSVVDAVELPTTNCLDGMASSAWLHRHGFNGVADAVTALLTANRETCRKVIRTGQGF